MLPRESKEKTLRDRTSDPFGFCPKKFTFFLSEEWDPSEGWNRKVCSGTLKSSSSRTSKGDFPLKDEKLILNFEERLQLISEMEPSTLRYRLFVSLSSDIRLLASNEVRLLATTRSGVGATSSRTYLEILRKVLELGSEISISEGGR